MTPTRSAGLLVHRGGLARLEVLVGHMGGPLWARRDDAAWSIPKGEPEVGEALEDAARREFTEELGVPMPVGEWLALGQERQRNGKIVTIWAVEGDLDPAAITPGTFEMEWPRGSGRLQSFPEIDRVGWFAPDPAGHKLVAGQRVFIDRLVALLG